METNPFRAQRRATERNGPAPTTARAAGPPRGAAGPGAGILDRAHAWVAARVAGRTWYYRAPLLLLFAWYLARYFGDPQRGSIFDALTLGFHEMGHAAFGLLGSHMLMVAGGTIFQLLVPTVAGLYLLIKQRDPFGAAVCLFWLGTSLINAGVYAADARAQALPLVSPFGPIDVDSHDWTVMLMRVGMLSKDKEIGSFLVEAGKLAMILATAGGAWVLRVMAVTRPAEEPE
jgi:hypothetical protein